MPDAPNWLAGEALDMWNEIAPLLFNAGVLTLRDRHALARLCKMREQYRKCIEFTDKYGLTYPSKDAQGQHRIPPAHASDRGPQPGDDHRETRGGLWS
jgi:P27 family predicted phage terminase small subunit